MHPCAVVAHSKHEKNFKDKSQIALLRSLTTSSPLHPFQCCLSKMPIDPLNIELGTSDMVGTGPVYTIPFSFHIGLVSYRIGLLFTRYRFHSISDWPPVYTRTHQSDMLHTVFAFSNENALKVA